MQLSYAMGNQEHIKTTTFLIVVFVLAALANPGSAWANDPLGRLNEHYQAGQASQSLDDSLALLDAQTERAERRAGQRGAAVHNQRGVEAISTPVSGSAPDPRRSSVQRVH